MAVKFVLWNVLFILLCFIAEELQWVSPGWLLEPLSGWWIAGLSIASIYLLATGFLLHVRSCSAGAIVEGRYVYLPREPGYENVGTFLLACGVMIVFVLCYRMW